MFDTIRHMDRQQARSFLQSAFDGPIPAELTAFANSLPNGPDLPEPLPTVSEQRAVIWQQIREVWQAQNRYDTHAEFTRLRLLGLSGVNAMWKERRLKTKRLLGRLAALKAYAPAVEERGTLLDRVA
jgi:hypothetical protein